MNQDCTEVSDSGPDDGGGDTTSGESTADAPFGETTTLDYTFDVLADRRRRYVLSLIRQSDDPVAVADAARKFAAWESDEPVDEVPDEAVERVAASLYHVHVPKMEDVGVVDFQEDRNVIALGDHAESVAPFLEAVTDE